MPTNQPIVLLRVGNCRGFGGTDPDGQVTLTTSFAQQGVVPPRPMTHDLLKNVIEELGHELLEVRIVALKDSIFHATLVFDGAVEVSARSSDAIALALRMGTSILVEDSLLDEAGVAIAAEEEDEVERFREFLDHVSAEDFDNPGEGGPAETWPPEQD